MAAPIQKPDTTSKPREDLLWRKRLTRETRIAARHARRGDRPNLSLTAIGGLLRLVGLYARGRRNAANLRVTRRRFVYPALPEPLAGFRILHLSDLHFAPDAAIDHLCALVADLECDLCVMTGDFARSIREPHDYMPGLMRTLAQTIRAPHGIVATLGNHDHSDDAASMNDLGIRVLVNEGFALSVGPATLWIAGVDDPHDFRADDLSRAVRGAPADAFTILLAHSPELYAAAAENGVQLYLCGHTHAGQLALPIVGPLFMNARCPRRFCRGQWRHGNLQGYTSAGVGVTALPVRYHCPPEVSLIELAEQ